MKTTTEWRLWGTRDPMYGVASWSGRARDGDRPWTESEFYALGDDWLDFAQHWRRYGLNGAAALEIGSGAGRITRRLAEDFTTVMACDVSEGMLEFARAHVSAPNVDWKLFDGQRLPAADASVDAVFSCHVFQHLENSTAQLEYFREVHRVLRSGGTFMIHTLMHSFPDAHPLFANLSRLAYRLYLAPWSAYAGLQRFMMRIRRKPYMHISSCEVPRLHAFLDGIGFSRVEVVVFPVRTNRSLHSFVLGTKP